MYRGVTTDPCHSLPRMVKAAEVAHFTFLKHTPSAQGHTSAHADTVSMTPNPNFQTPPSASCPLIPPSLPSSDSVQTHEVMVKTQTPRAASLAGAPFILILQTCTSAQHLCLGMLGYLSSHCIRNAADLISCDCEDVSV